jgi:toxin ParE1/3/4
VKLRWTTAATQELESAVRYYDRQKVGLGVEFAAVLKEALLKISSRPEGFSFVEALSSALGYRRIRLSRFPYIVVFQPVSQELIRVVAISHTSRKQHYWLNRD